jgi:hypothetical protein
MEIEQSTSFMMSPPATPTSFADHVEDRINTMIQEMDEYAAENTVEQIYDEQDLVIV